MRRIVSHSHDLVIVILASIILFYGVASASGVASYQPGVKPGDSATYGQVNASWTSSVAPVSPVKYLLGVSSIALSVQSVVESSVTARQTYNYSNGTTRSSVWVENVESGAGNMSSTIAWIIAGSLVADEPIYNSPSASAIEQTVQGVYAGSLRTVNVINSTQPEPGGFCKFLRIWDQSTGMLLGFALNYTVSNANYHVSAFASAQLSQTNAWVLPEHTGMTPASAPIFGLVIFAAAIGSSGAFALHGKRHHPESPWKQREGTEALEWKSIT